MPRIPLQPQQLGTPTLTRVTKQPNGKYKADPRGKHWEARIRVGQLSGPPRLIRRTAKTKQAALDEAVKAARDYASAGAAHFSTITTLTDLWRAHQNSSQWQELSTARKRTFIGAQRQSEQIQASLWVTPIFRTLLVEHWDAHLQAVAQKHGTFTARNTKALLLRLLTPYRGQLNLQALRESVIPKGIRVRVTGNDPGRVFTKEEFKQIREHLRLRAGSMDTQPEKSAALFYINTYLGLRVGELAALSIDQFNEDRTALTAYSIKTKKLYATKPLPEWVQETVKTLCSKSDSGQLLNLTAQSLGERGAALLRELGYQWATSHTIRKTVGSIVFDEKGARVAAQWLAHSNVATTLAHYVKTDRSLGDDPLDF